MIVVFITSTAVYLGADSLQLNVQGGKQDRRAICKLKNVGDCYYAVQGMSGSETFDVDLSSLARDACMQPGSLAERASFYDAKAYPQVVRLFSEAARYSPITTLNNSAVVFAIIEAGEPSIMIVNYWRDEHRVVQRRRGGFRGRDVHREPLVVTFGVQEALNKEKKTHPMTYAAGPPATAIERMLGAEIKNAQNKPLNEQLLATPISLVEISSQGARWIHRGMCTVPTVKRNRRSGRP